MSVFSIGVTTTGKMKTWVALISFRDYKGKRHQIRRHVSSALEAQKVESELLERRSKGELPNQAAVEAKQDSASLKLGSYLEEWLQMRASDLAASTLENYSYLMRRHVVPQIGEIPLERLTPIQIKGVYQSLVASGLSSNTALRVHRALRRALQDAIEIYEILSKNPAKPQIAPKAAKFIAEVVGDEELWRIFDKIRSTKLQPIVFMAAFTGLRLGELLGLRFDDIDFDHATLLVQRSYNKRGIFSPPKTEQSRRRLDLSAATMTMLEKLRQQYDLDRSTHGTTFNVEGFLFATELGQIRSQSSIEYEWRTLMKSIGLKIRFHDLRHAHASHLLAAGWEVSAVAERLGHSTPATTLNFYSHALPSRRKAMAADVDRIFGAAEFRVSTPEG